METYLLAVKAANKSPTWELPEATELFKLMHNKYAEAQRLLGDFSLGIMQREYQDYLWNSRNKNLGSKVTTATTAPLQAMPPEVLQKERKHISMG